MEQTLCEKVQETAQRCGTEFLKLPLQNPVNGMGTDGHPLHAAGNCVICGKIYGTDDDVENR